MKAYAIDTNNTSVIDRLASVHYVLGKYEESLKYYKKYIALIKEHGERIDNNAYYKIGLAYWHNGHKEEANYYFKEQINICNRANELGGPWSQSFVTYHRLAKVYALLGDKDKAFENLRILNQKQKLPAWIVAQIKNGPVYYNIRDEPEFQQIVRDVEAKYKAEHERVRG